MTVDRDALAVLEPVFLAASKAAGRPWPPDPWLGAKARAAWSVAQHDRHDSEAMRELAGANAIAEAFEASLTDEQRLMRETYDLHRARAREHVEVAGRWATVALSLVRLADEELRDASPWCAPPPSVVEPAAEWRLDENGWICLGGVPDGG